MYSKASMMLKLAHVFENLHDGEAFTCNCKERWCWSLPMNLKGMMMLNLSDVFTGVDGAEVLLCV